MILDISIDQIFGKGYLPLFISQIYRLIIDQPGSIQNYLSRVEELFEKHKIQEKLSSFQNNWDIILQ